METLSSPTLFIIVCWDPLLILKRSPFIILCIFWAKNSSRSFKLVNFRGSFASPNSSILLVPQDDEYIGMVRREVLDDFLRQRAKKNGATLINGLFLGASAVVSPIICRQCPISPEMGGFRTSQAGGWWLGLLLYRFSMFFILHNLYQFIVWWCHHIFVMVRSC